MAGCTYPRAFKIAVGSSFEEVELLRPAVLQGRLLLAPIALFLESSISKTHGTSSWLVGRTAILTQSVGAVRRAGVESNSRNIKFVSKALVLSFDLSSSTISVEFESLVSQFKSDTIRVHAHSTEFEFSALLASAS